MKAAYVELGGKQVTIYIFIVFLCNICCIRTVYVCFLVGLSLSVLLMKSSNIYYVSTLFASFRQVTF